jgi:uncharacterized protein YpbB
MYLEGIIIDCISKIQENRSISGIFHLLLGKKSIQTVHDARIFQLERYYGIYPKLRRMDLNKIVSSITEEGLFEKGEREGFYRVTKQGEVFLQKCKERPLYTYFKGLRYTGMDVIFFNRLHLLVQTYSNIRMKNTAFIPVVDNLDATVWVKDFYKKNWKSAAPIDLYEELHKLLQNLEKEEAEILVDRLSGFQHYGMSVDQLALHYHLSIHDVYLVMIGIIHNMIDQIKSQKENYPFLARLIQDDKGTKFITNTANQTYQLLLNNYSLETIAQIRKLKLNTVYDHIVEIALYDDDFSIDPFVDVQLQEEIIAVVNRYNTYKLKTIKDNCNPIISYFQIRLVLTRLKERLLEDEFNA